MMPVLALSERKLCTLQNVTNLVRTCTHAALGAAAHLDLVCNMHVRQTAFAITHSLLLVKDVTFCSVHSFLSEKVKIGMNLV